MYNDQKLKSLRQELRGRATDAERKLWYYLRKRSFLDLRFFRQYSVGPYVLDFFCPKIRLAIELDGGQHNDPKSKLYDASRTEFLNGLDIRVVRFWNNQVMNEIESMLEQLRTNPSCLPLLQGEDSNEIPLLK